MSEEIRNGLMEAGRFVHQRIRVVLVAETVIQIVNVKVGTNA